MILAIKPQFYYFPSSFLNSLLLHNFNLSPPPPHSWIPSFSIWLFSLPILFYFPLPPQFFLFSLLNLAFPPPPQFYYFPSSSSAFSFKLYIFPSKNTSTSYQPCIDPRLFFFFQHSFVDSETIYNHHHISIVSIIHKTYLLWLFQ